MDTGKSNRLSVNDNRWVKEETVECVALLVRQFETAKAFVNVGLDMSEYRELKNRDKDWTMKTW